MAIQMVGGWATYAKATERRAKQVHERQVSVVGGERGAQRAGVLDTVEKHNNLERHDQAEAGVRQVGETDERIRAARTRRAGRRA